MHLVMHAYRGSIEAKAAFALVLVGIVLLPFVRASDVDAVAVALPWIAGVVLSAVAIIRFRGKARPWPAYAALGVVVVGVLAAMPPSHRASGTATEQATSVLDARLADRDAPALERLVTGCAAALGRPCTPAELRRADANGGDGSRVVQQVTDANRDVGRLAITSTVDPSGRVSTACEAVERGVSKDAARRACATRIGR